MTNINLLISGPIRPNIKYLNYIIDFFKKSINHNTIVFLCYWDDIKIDKSLIENVDFLFNENEPDDKQLFEKITSRTKQQKQLGTIEEWTPRIYKMFYGIKKLVDNIENKSLINDDDIVLRIRTDLYVEDCELNLFNILLNNIDKNTVYNRYRTHTCDWFSISSYNIFKKIWYIKNIKEHNKIIKNLFNAEEIITYKSNINKIKIVDIKNIINLCVCREYDDENNTKLDRYD